MCVCIATDLIVNNKGGANLKERWTAREMSTDSLLSALLSKDCGKGKEVSVGGGERSPSRGVREEKLLLLLSVFLCVGIKRCVLASRPEQSL